LQDVFVTIIQSYIQYTNNHFYLVAKTQQPEKAKKCLDS